ncbi:MAG: hypothetical protein JNK78_00800 [Planctomycetes bacterium]|nr:hypothetical protein [Planctomycetota bacterium]
MHRCFQSLSPIVLLAASAAAQCLDLTSVGSTIGSGDEVLFAPVAMGITFPMAGAPAGSFTHCAVTTNGVLYLTNGAAPVGGSGSAYGGSAQMQGAVGDSPRIAPYWKNMVCPAPASYVAIDTSVAGRCAVTWVAANEFLAAPTKNFRAELFASGVIRFGYSQGMGVDNATATVGVSVGNGIADPGASDLSAGPTSATGIVYQLFDAAVPLDVTGRTIQFTPSGGGYVVAAVCEPAYHQAYGAGCYGVASESFYQLFPTAAAASAALNGQSMRLTPTANGYSATWGGGSYVAPIVGAVPLPANDDDQTAVTPSIPLPVPGGAASTLWVHTNGFVSTAATNDSVFDDALWNPPTFSDYAPTSGFRNAPATAFWSWHDYISSSGAGRIKRHEAVVGPDTILYVTWDAVESYPAATANPSTFQFQFNLTTGVVTYVWQSITAIGTGGSPFLPEGHLVGYSPGGASLDPGSIVLASALPLVTQPDQAPLTLSASPAPVYTIGGPTVPVTWTATNVPSLLPPLPLGVTILIFSVAPFPGLDLGFVDMPGCNLNVASLDVTLPMAGGTSPTDSVTLSMPQPLSPGLAFYSQALSLFPPNSLPNGQNAFGAVLSNGLKSSFNTF